MPWVSKEQITHAKSIPILDYILAHEPDNVRRVGGEYRLKDHSITMSHGKWHWQSQGIGGASATALNYLISVRGYSFADAVLHLTGTAPAYEITPKARPPTERKAFALPPRNQNNSRVVEYLQKRGIDKMLIRRCIADGSLYESHRYSNCVFVGRDTTGKARFAALRSTSGDFKRDAIGSDKRFGFILPPKNNASNIVAAFESPIDLLSHACLFPDFDGWRLSLGGTSVAALTHFLEHHSEVNHCVICTDNDAAGNRAAARIAELPDITTSREIPLQCKDWNEFLLQQKELNHLEDVRKDILFLEEPFKYPESFRIKDGESVKMTYSYDGETEVLKCRFIDETHLYLGNNAYHISELAERLQRSRSTVEPIPGQKPMLDIVAAKYGEPLKDVTVPMTEAAIRKQVGGAYTTELIQNETKTYTYGILLRGKEGMAVCGVGSDKISLTSLHPYNAQSVKRDLSTEPPTQAEPAKRESLRDKLERGKEKSAQQSASPPKNRNAQELE
ncbi:toprim domain-containing protein [Ruminococcaceae bacterium OttesenSCG-928-L11]|nr:toprim domain-containing protein [Ruminococcaceae bacterium OttesenSCG-928-L11]